jgi:hypothetical protein
MMNGALAADVRDLKATVYRERFMSILRIGSSGKYSENWEAAFGKKPIKSAPAKKAQPKKRSSKKAKSK